MTVKCRFTLGRFKPDRVVRLAANVKHEPRVRTRSSNDDSHDRLFPLTSHRPRSDRNGRARRLPCRCTAGAAGSRRQDRHHRRARRRRRQCGSGRDRRRGASLGRTRESGERARVRQLVHLALAAASGAWLGAAARNHSADAALRPALRPRWSISWDSCSRCCRLEAGRALVSGYSAWLQVAFAGENLPTSVPRLAVVALTAIVAVLAIGGVMAARTIGSRRAEHGWWWRIVAAPFDAHAARDRFVEAVWELIRGAAPVARPSSAALGRRYAEVLSENLGQPGFRELVVVTTDLDARRDVVATLLAEPYRQSFLAPRPGRDRRSEVLDLAGVSRDHVIDVDLRGASRRRCCATRTS